MKDFTLFRALFNEERDSYVVEEYGEMSGEPAVEYTFTSIQDDEDDLITAMLAKWVLDEEGETVVERVPFGEYPTEAAFNDAVAAIRQEAQQYAINENLDAFLAVVDIVKQWAVVAQLLDEEVLWAEGLFEDGPEDAYTLREMAYDTRLHDHVERPTDECWRLHAARVVDPAREALGWAVFLVYYPELTSESEQEQIEQADYARILDVDHCVNELDARYAIDQLYGYMENERMEDPELAYEDDTMVLELISEGKRQDGDYLPDWRELHEDELLAFLNGSIPVVIERKDWYPREDSLSAFARKTQMSTHWEDQLRSSLMTQYGVQEPFEEDSPWNRIDLDL